MAERHDQPEYGHIAATAAVLVLAGLFATPVLAAPDRNALCAKSLEANLEIRADTVSTTIGAVADDHLLKPRVEATAREVFADNTSETETETETEEIVEMDSDDDESAAPRLRSISDNQLVPFRRQMYRRDI